MADAPGRTGVAGYELGEHMEDGAEVEAVKGRQGWNSKLCESSAMK